MQKYLVTLDNVPTWISCPPEAATSLLRCRTLVDLGRWVREHSNPETPGELFGRPRTMIESSAVIAVDTVEYYEQKKGSVCNEDLTGQTAEGT